MESILQLIIIALLIAILLTLRDMRDYARLTLFKIAQATPVLPLTVPQRRPGARQRLQF